MPTQHFHFTLVIEPGEDGWFVASVPEVPGVLTQGKTVDEARANAHEALELVLETLREDGQELPPAAAPRSAYCFT